MGNLCKRRYNVVAIINDGIKNKDYDAVIDTLADYLEEKEYQIYGVKSKEIICIKIKKMDWDYKMSVYKHNGVMIYNKEFVDLKQLMANFSFMASGTSFF
jgi:hypothetical protein